MYAFGGQPEVAEHLTKFKLYVSASKTTHLPVKHHRNTY